MKVKRKTSRGRKSPKKCKVIARKRSKARRRAPLSPIYRPVHGAVGLAVTAAGAKKALDLLS